MFSYGVICIVLYVFTVFFLSSPRKSFVQSTWQKFLTAIVRRSRNSKTGDHLCIYCCSSMCHYGCYMCLICVIPVLPRRKGVKEGDIHCYRLFAPDRRYCRNGGTIGRSMYLLICNHLIFPPRKLVSVLRVEQSTLRHSLLHSYPCSYSTMGRLRIVRIQ